VRIDLETQIISGGNELLEPREAQTDSTLTVWDILKIPISREPMWAWAGTLEILVTWWSWTKSKWKNVTRKQKIVSHCIRLIVFLKTVINLMMKGLIRMQDQGCVLEIQQFNQMDSHNISILEVSAEMTGWDTNTIQSLWESQKQNR